jgi:hypothetical protein
LKGAIVTAKAIIAARLPVRRGLSEGEAATYLSFSASFFRQLVMEKVMPPPRIAKSRRIWDIEELDAAFKALPQETDGSDEADVWSDCAT